MAVFQVREHRLIDIRRDWAGRAAHENADRPAFLKIKQLLRKAGLRNRGIKQSKKIWKPGNQDKSNTCREIWTLFVTYAIRFVQQRVMICVQSVLICGSSLLVSWLPDSFPQFGPLKMRRFALEVSAAAEFANELAVPCRNLATHGDDMRAHLDFETLKRIVIEIHLMRFGEDFSAVIGIVDNEIGVAA